METKQQLKQPNKLSASPATSHQRMSTVLQEEDFVTVTETTMYAPGMLSASDISLLQGAIGNQAATRILQQNSLTPNRASSKQPAAFVQPHRVMATNMVQRQGLEELLDPELFSTESIPESAFEFSKIPGETPFNPSMGQSVATEVGTGSMEGATELGLEGATELGAESATEFGLESAAEFGLEGAAELGLEGAGAAGLEGAGAVAGAEGLAALGPVGAVAAAGAAGYGTGRLADEATGGLMNVTGASDALDAWRGISRPEGEHGDYSISGVIGMGLTSLDQSLTSLWADPSKPEYTQTLGWKIADWLTPTSNEEPTQEMQNKIQIPNIIPPAQLPGSEEQNSNPAIDPATDELLYTPADQNYTPLVEPTSGEPLYTPADQSYDPAEFGDKTGRKKSKDVLENQRERVEQLRRERDKLKSTPNKTPEINEEVKRKERELKKAEDKLRASENHAQKSQKPSRRN